MKNKLLITLLFFCSLQHTLLFSMENENQGLTQQNTNTDNPNSNDPIYQEISNRLSKVPNFSSKDFKFKKEMEVINSFLDDTKNQDTNKNYQAIKSVLKKLRPDTLDVYIQEMESTYKYKQPENNNSGEYYAPITIDLTNTAEIKNTTNNLLEEIKQLTFAPENLEKEKEIICDLIKAGPQSNLAKQYYKILSLKLHPDKNKDKSEAERTNAEKLFKFMSTCYNGEHAQIITTQYEYDFNKIVLKKESINGKKDSVKSAIEAFNAPLLLQIASTIPSLQYKGVFFLTHKVIHTAYNTASNKLFGTDTSDCYVSQLKNEISESTQHNNDLTAVINREYEQTKMLINRYLQRNN